MNSSLIEFLRKFIPLTDNEASFIHSLTTSRRLKKGEVFLEQDKIAQEIGFVLSGVLRYYVIDNSGNEITYLFKQENNLFTNLDSFYNNKPGHGTIEAETEAEILVFSKTSWLTISETVKEWDSTIRKIYQNSLIEHITFQRKLIDQEASASYLDFLREYPTIAQRVPASHLASFLGITRHSLSRIKKKLSSSDES